MQGARVSQADILAGHAQQAPTQVERVGASIEHAGKPVKSRIGIAPPHRLMQRRDQVVELIAAFIETTHTIAQSSDHGGLIDFVCLSAGMGHILKSIEEPASITISVVDQNLGGL